MSTNYEPLKDLSYKKMKRVCTDIEFVKNENSSNKWGEVIRQNDNWLHFYETDNKVCSFARYGANDVESIIGHIQFRMGVPIYDEYSDEYHELWLSNLTEEERKEYEKDMLDE